MKKIYKNILKYLGIISGILLGIVGIFPELLNITSIKQRIIFCVTGIVLVSSSFFLGPFVSKLRFFILRFKRIKIGISFDPISDKEIVNFCNKEMQNLGLSQRIIFESVTLKHESQKKFEKLVVKSKFDVVVWIEKTVKFRNKVELKFTFKDRTDQFIGKIINKELNSLVSIQNMFNLNKETLYLDLDIEKNNIADFSLYIVALCTTLFRGINNGILVFEKLSEKLTSRSGILKENVFRRLKDLYSFKGRDLLVKRKNLPYAINVLTKGYEIKA